MLFCTNCDGVDAALGAVIALQALELEPLVLSRGFHPPRHAVFYEFDMFKLQIYEASRAGGPKSIKKGRGRRHD